MRQNNAARIALEAMTVIARGMNQLEVGQLAVIKFGEKTTLLHDFDQTFTDQR